MDGVGEGGPGHGGGQEVGLELSSTDTGLQLTYNKGFRLQFKDIFYAFLNDHTVYSLRKPCTAVKAEVRSYTVQGNFRLYSF